MAQLNLVVGDVDGNTSRIVAATHEARTATKRTWCCCPSLRYPAIRRRICCSIPECETQVTQSIERLKREVRGITLVAGYPEYEGTRSSMRQS